jgi:hypothetical protein
MLEKMGKRGLVVSSLRLIDRLGAKWGIHRRGREEREERRWIETCGTSERGAHSARHLSGAVWGA